MESSDPSSAAAAAAAVTTSKAEIPVCDESKCVSRALSDLHDGSFTCYGDDGEFYPRMCADGFLPVVVPDEPSLEITKTDKRGTTTPVTLSYYTCCPPAEQDGDAASDSLITNPARRCSDPIAISHDSDIAGAENGSICDHEDLRKHPFPMKTNVISPAPLFYSVTTTDSLLCCDNEVNLTSDSVNSVDIDFLGGTDCVPYRSEFYEDFRAINKPAMLRPITCDFPKGSFQFARPLDGDTPDEVWATGRYQCCKTGDALPPFVQDSTFRNFVYPSLAFHVFALVVTLMVAVALLLPLLAHLLNGTSFQSQRSCSQDGSSLFLKSNFTHAGDSSQWSLRSWRGSLGRMRSRKKKGYSSYNLYVIYLLFSDIVYLLFQIAVLSSYANQKFLHWGQWLRKSDLIYGYLSWEKAFVAPYLFFNLFVNAVIAYEILQLLRASSNMRRVKQPSLTRVNLECVAGIGLGIFNISVPICLFMHFTEKALDGVNYGMLKIIDVTFFSAFVICDVMPIAYVAYVVFLIWWKGYIPSANGTVKDKCMRELILFLGRVVAAFMLIWTPMLFLYPFAHHFSSGWAYVLVKILTGLQPLLTVAATLTKLDARKHVLNLCQSLVCWSKPETKQNEDSEKISSIQAIPLPSIDGISIRSGGYRDGSSKTFDPSLKRSVVVIGEVDSETGATDVGAEAGPKMDVSDGGAKTFKQVSKDNVRSDFDEDTNASSDTGAEVDPETGGNDSGIIHSDADADAYADTGAVVSAETTA